MVEPDGSERIHLCDREFRGALHQRLTVRDILWSRGRVAGR